MKRYLPIIIFLKLAELVQFFTAWAVVLFAVKFTRVKYTGRLPCGFQWMETPDEKLPGGLYEPQVKAIYDRFGWTACAIYWLMRNRAYRLSRRWAYWPRVVIGDDAQPRVYQGRVKGDIRVGDDEGDREGACWFYAGDAWEFYKVKRLFMDFGYRIRLGWKLAPFFRTDFADWPYDPEKTAWGMPVLHVSLRRIKSEKLK